MTSFSGCFFLVSMVVSLPFLLASSSTLSTKYIDTICNNSKNKTFCLQTLTTYPPAVSETNMVSLVKIVLGLGLSHAEKTTGFVAELAKEPTFKRYLKVCNDSYTGIVSELKVAIVESDEDPLSANYDIRVCADQSNIVKYNIGNNTDKSSKSLMEMTFLMDKFIDICDGATRSICSTNI
ncbi:unnamed protein product [Eruca vesicaria subsp. sativa]|uniref:Pectinesterase inhibitor domain-containing protein n=1 Tax=Eruca vesicaria subsp. sativa TaxID=29727 RepID=A0ABC8JGE0_ERUVS|nr:unnamed protein product [Eruca vesicaria subsp. sativa]